MARCRARVEFLLSVIELLFLYLTVEALHGIICQNSLSLGGGRSVGTKISWGKSCSHANMLILLEFNFFLCLLRLRRYKAKPVKTRCYQEGVGQFEPRFQGEDVVPGEYFLVCTKLNTFSYPMV